MLVAKLNSAYPNGCGVERGEQRGQVTLMLHPSVTQRRPWIRFVAWGLSTIGPGPFDSLVSLLLALRSCSASQRAAASRSHCSVRLLIAATSARAGCPFQFERIECCVVAKSFKPWAAYRIPRSRRSEVLRMRHLQRVFR
jgi:hypothetical protein